MLTVGERYQIALRDCVDLRADLKAKNAEVARLRQELADAVELRRAFAEAADVARQDALTAQRDVAALEARLAAGREETCDTCAHAYEYEGSLSCGLTESGGAIARMSGDCRYWERKEES